jgi:hypothetical protein
VTKRGVNAEYAVDTSVVSMLCAFDSNDDAKTRNIPNFSLSDRACLINLKTYQRCARSLREILEIFSFKESLRSFE